MIFLRFLVSFLLFLLQLIVIFISFPTVAIMLLTPWSGSTTWFGNFKYPRGVGNVHMSANPTYFEQWFFLCIRNPVSNFGKFVLGVNPEWTWPWYYNIHLFGRYYTKFGWKTGSTGGKRTFVFRPIWRD